MNTMRKEIENRLINFSVSIINLCRKMNSEFVSQHLANQIIRSSSSSALNYGEAQGAESHRDFIHKTSLVLKELRETHVCLKIIKNANLTNMIELNNHAIKECNELISIFHQTVKTAKSNNKLK
jgi:four helix bundle protein